LKEKDKEKDKDKDKGPQDENSIVNAARIKKSVLVFIFVQSSKNMRRFA